MQEFLDEAEEGVIYFSLGSYVKSTDMPKDKMQAILDGFSNLNQRVLWKYEDDSLILPDNVKIGKWFPQSDILAHPNVILFITHGGVFGTQEGLYRGVPMLFIPLYGDQVGLQTDFLLYFTHRNSFFPASKCSKNGDNWKLPHPQIF